MPEKSPDVIVPIAFDDDALGTDLEHLSDAASTALHQLRRQVERDGGLSKSRLPRCQPEGRDGTRLGGCTNSRSLARRTVGHRFRAGEAPTRPFALYTLAYGERHPSRTGKPSVYQIASQRLEEILAEDLRSKRA